jgi:hypothetical protein
LYYKDTAKEARVVEAVNQVAPDHPKRQELEDKLFEVAKYEFSVQDIVDIAKEVLKGDSNKSEENSSKDPASSSKAGAPQRTASTEEEKSESQVFDPFTTSDKDRADWDMWP